MTGSRLISFAGRFPSWMDTAGYVSVGNSIVEASTGGLEYPRLPDGRDLKAIAIAASIYPVVANALGTIAQSIHMDFGFGINLQGDSDSLGHESTEGGRWLSTLSGFDDVEAGPGTEDQHYDPSNPVGERRMRFANGLWQPVDKKIPNGSRLQCRAWTTRLFEQAEFLWTVIIQVVPA